MNKKEEVSFKKIIEKMNNISLEIEKLKPFAEIKEVKKFVKSAHIILNKNLIGQEVLVIKFPKKNQI